MHALHHSATRKNKVFEDQMVMQGVPILVTKKLGVNFSEGFATARRHKKEGEMNIFKPQLKNKNAQNHIKTNKSTRMNHQRYSDKPIPLLIEYF